MKSVGITSKIHFSGTPGAIFLTWSMVFNSGVFVFFFCVVLITYWALAGLPRGLRYQNRFLLLASYFFYGYWDWIFLTLILISTVVDYFAARGIEDAGAQKTGVRKRWMFLSIGVNLGLLGVFKYFDFFTGSLVALVHQFSPGVFPDQGNSLLLNVILPVGISFYTFQTMSYTIDVYRGQIKAERNFLDFALFVCFFPQLVAGPIERAGDLLPQFKRERKFDLENLQKGLWLVLIGFFMKVYVADNLAVLVDQVYLPGKGAYLAALQTPARLVHGGYQVMAANIAFVFQIYGDFAGYSIIALGISRMMGIKLSINFSTPQFSQTPVELWRRWHVTLNRWIIDYIYIPLGGSRMGEFAKQRNIFLTFTIMGLWHGANWTFAIWGAYHGAILVLYSLFADKLPRMSENAAAWKKMTAQIIKMILVYGGVLGMSVTLFRAYDIHHTYLLWKSIFTLPWNMTDEINGVAAAFPYTVAIFRKIFVLLIIDWVAFRKGNVYWVFEAPVWLRVLIYSTLFYCIVILGFWGKDVIYFAF